MKVLFCGRDMTWGFQFSYGELQSDENISVIQCDREDVPQQIADADVVVPLMTSLPAELLHRASSLKLILQYGAGVEAVDIQAATKLGIFVSNIPSNEVPNAASCAEMAIFLTLASLRHVRAMEESIQKRLLGVPLGTMLQGKTVLVIGFGNISKELIIRLSSFGVFITCLRRSPWEEANSKRESTGFNRTGSDIEGRDDKKEGHNSELERRAEALLGDRGTWPEDTSRLASHADIVIVTCIQDAKNKGMVGGEFLAACKQGVRSVNVARGGLLDYAAVLENLNSGKIGGMGLDVQFWEPFDPEDPIAQHPAVYLTPHIAGVTEESYRAMAKVVAAEARKVLLRKQPPTVQLNSECEMREKGQIPRIYT